MKKNIKVSIVTPSFNQGQYLEKTINSVLSQDYDNLEYFIIDGGSTDNSVNIMKKYEKKISGWVSESDKGQSHAINKGINLCDGEIFGYINSDDYYEPELISNIVKIFIDNPNIDIIYGNFNYVDKDHLLLSNQYTIPFIPGIFIYDFDFICQPASFWRKDVFDKCGTFNEELQYLMDYEFFLRCYKYGMNYKYVNRTIANLRLHSDCKTISGQRDFKIKYKKIRQDILSPYQNSIVNIALGKYGLFLLKIINRLKYYFIYFLFHRKLKESYQQVLLKLNRRNASEA